MQSITPTQKENANLGIVEPVIGAFSETNLYERQFLNALLLRKKPKKIIEIGVSAGGSSALILNTLFENSIFYAVDYSKEWYRDSSKKTGYVISEFFPQFSKKYQLRTGGLVADFLEEMGGGIDFAFIDTMHRNPGEILDFLMLLPFLKNNATVVFHDTALYTTKKSNAVCITNSLLLSTIKGEKFIPKNPDHIFPNIGAIVLNKRETQKTIFDIFNLLTLPFVYLPTQVDFLKISTHFRKYYVAEYAEMFEKSYEYNKEYLK